MDVNDRESVGERIRAVRLSAGVGLRQLARSLEISPSTLSACESGRINVSVDRLEQIATALALPLTDLLPPDSREEWPRLAVGADTDKQSIPGPYDSPQPDPNWRVYGALELDEALGAALQVFLDVGYHGASIRRIASVAGMSIPGLYHYYPSKLQLLESILDMTMFDLMARSLGARDEAADPVTRFSNLVECLALFHTHRRVLGFIGASETRSLSSEGRARFAAARRQQQRMIDLEITAAIREGHFSVDSVPLTGRAVSSLCIALCQWYRPGGLQGPEELAAEYVQFAYKLVNYREA